MEHAIRGSLLRGRVKVHLVGVGGNGAQMANCLARLDIAMRALGHPGGLHVTAFDADRVSPSNVGRQIYSRADVGQFKSLLTINRLNQFYGLDWHALPTMYGPTKTLQPWSEEPHIVISCVDSARARRALHEDLFKQGRPGRYWLDLGNTESSGQVVLGETRGAKLAEADEFARLPCVTELFSNLLDATEPEVDEPSCSVAISLATQGLFVNDMVVRWASQILYSLFTKGRLRHHGVMVNLESLRAAPIDVNPGVWRRFGVIRRKPRARRRPGG